jgi:hypothetical protein
MNDINIVTLDDYRFAQLFGKETSFWIKDIERIGYMVERSQPTFFYQVDGLFLSITFPF